MGMFDGVMKMSFLHKLNISPIFLAYGESNKNKKKTNYRERSRSSMAAVHAVPIKISSSITGLTRSQSPNSKVKESNLVGVIGGASSCSTLIFLAKLVFWSSRNDEECVPFIVSSDPSINKEGPKAVIENLRVKRVYLERGGAKFIVMPCHVFQLWHREISEGCSVPFFDLCDCVVNELGNARLKPLEIGRKVRIGVIAKDSALIGGYYLEKLQNQGFEVVLLDKETTDHIITPAIEALKRKDMEGARNLLRIAIHLLLVRAVNRVILASDEFQGLLPHDDPLLKKCINPMDALARSTIKWTRSVEKVKDQLADETLAELQMGIALKGASDDSIKDSPGNEGGDTDAGADDGYDAMVDNIIGRYLTPLIYHPSPVPTQDATNLGDDSAPVESAFYTPSAGALGPPSVSARTVDDIRRQIEHMQGEFAANKMEKEQTIAALHRVIAIITAANVEQKKEIDHLKASLLQEKESYERSVSNLSAKLAKSIGEKRDILMEMSVHDVTQKYKELAVDTEKYDLRRRCHELAQEVDTLKNTIETLNQQHADAADEMKKKYNNLTLNLKAEQEINKLLRKEKKEIAKSDVKMRVVLNKQIQDLQTKLNAHMQTGGGGTPTTLAVCEPQEPQPLSMVMPTDTPDAPSPVPMPKSHGGATQKVSSMVGRVKKNERQPKKQGSDFVYPKAKGKGKQKERSDIVNVDELPPATMYEDNAILPARNSTTVGAMLVDNDWEKLSVISKEGPGTFVFGGGKPMATVSCGDIICMIMERRVSDNVIDSYGECLEDQIRSINHMRMSMSNELLHETRFALSCIWNVIREDNNVLLKELYYTISTAFSKENRYVVFPMNTNGRHASPNHWTVMVLDIHDKKWTFYNSIHPRKNTTDHYYNDALTVKRFVERHINMEIHPDWGDARIEQCLDSPQQREAIDCGIFVMYIMKQYAANMPVAKKLSVADVRGVRRDVIHALVNHPHYSWVPVVGGDVEKIQPDQGIP